MTAPGACWSNHFASGVRFDLAVFTDKPVYVQTVLHPDLLAEVAALRDEVSALRAELGGHSPSPAP